MTDDRDKGTPYPDAPTQVRDASADGSGGLPDLGPKFEVLECIGQGGMGSVYRVRHRDLQRIRAVKVLLPGGSDEMVERLRREAAMATDLAHPNIVTVYDLERLPDGRLAIVMEYLDGEDLGTRIRNLGPLAVDELPELFHGVADALDRMHEQGVIHRDLKPDNLFICDDGTVKVLDFGISRYVVQDDGLTQTGRPLGTPAFMAPEQFAGTDLSPRTDVFALGGVLYLCLTGRLPVAGTGYAEMVAAALYQVPPRADEGRDDVPDHVADALAAALAKKPEQRPASATELLAALSGESRIEPPPPEVDTLRWVPSVQVSEPAEVPGASWKGWMVPLVGTLALAFVVGIYAYWRHGQADRLAGVEQPVTGAVETPADVPQRGGVLRAGAPTSLPTLDPLHSDISEGQMAICRLLHDTLVTLDWTGEVRPLLATEWTVAEDRRTFAFLLRDDARFHDDPCFEEGRGRLLVADDVKASLERTVRRALTQEGHPLADMPRIEGTAAWIDGSADHLEGIETPDEHTVVVRFERPNTEFLHILSWMPWSITAREALDAYAQSGDVGRHVVGTGPYRLAAEAEGADLVLVPHPDAWQRDTEGGQLPYPDRLEFHAYPGPVAASTSLREGRIDLLIGVGDELLAEFFTVESGRASPLPGWAGMQAGGYLNDAMREQRVMALDFRSTSPLVQDQRARRAISLAIQRDTFVPEDSFPTISPLVVGAAGSATRGTADPSSAKALLAEARQTWGGEPPALTICGTESNHDPMRAIQTHLEAVGLSVTVVAAEPRAMYGYVSDGGCDALMLAMVGLVVDDDPLEFLISYAAMVELGHRVHGVGETIEQARNEGDPGRRSGYVAELARLIEEDAMLVVLSQRRAGIPDFAFIASDRVGGFTDPRTSLMNPLRERLHQLWVRPEEP